jgi:CheY-like chemotaxis protein
MNSQTTAPDGKKILVVDDDKVIVKTLSMLLNANGYKVFTAADGPGAASIVKQEKPDLILLDILFPPDAMNIGGALQDGYFIMQWLRRMGAAETTPIIVISGNNSKKDQKQALDAGAVAFFTKPVDRSALLATIRSALEKSAAPPPTAPGPA